MAWVVFPIVGGGNAFVQTEHVVAITPLVDPSDSRVSLRDAQYIEVCGDTDTVFDVIREAERGAQDERAK